MLVADAGLGELVARVGPELDNVVHFLLGAEELELAAEVGQVYALCAEFAGLGELDGVRVAFAFAQLVDEQVADAVRVVVLVDELAAVQADVRPEHARHELDEANDMRLVGIVGKQLAEAAQISERVAAEYGDARDLLDHVLEPLELLGGGRRRVRVLVARRQAERLALVLGEQTLGHDERRLLLVATAAVFDVTSEHAPQEVDVLVEQTVGHEYAQRVAQGLEAFARRRRHDRVAKLVQTVQTRIAVSILAVVQWLLRSVGGVRLVAVLGLFVVVVVVVRLLSIAAARRRRRRPVAHCHSHARVEKADQEADAFTFLFFVLFIFFETKFREEV